MGQSKALLRSDHAALVAAIVAVLVAGIIAAFLLPRGGIRPAAQEKGSLLAPPSEGGFSDAFGIPGAPSSALGADEIAGGSGSSDDGGTPPAPSPSPRPRTPPPVPPAPPPEDERLLGLLDDILPPVLPPGAAERAVEGVAAITAKP